MTRELTGDQRRLVVLFAVFLGLVTMYLGRGLFEAGGRSGAAPPPPERSTALVSARADIRVAHHPARAAKKHAARTRASSSLAATDSFEVFETRDPFEPPFNNTPPETSAPATPTTQPGGSTTPATTPPAATTTTQAASFNPGTSETIAVLDVYTDASGATRARVQVGSTVYTVGVGDTFATSYKVVSLKEPCGQFLFGDSPFTLCEGEETIK